MIRLDSAGVARVPDCIDEPDASPHGGSFCPDAESTPGMFAVRNQGNANEFM